MRIRAALYVVKEVAAIWKKLWKAVTRFWRLRSGDGRGCAACRRNLENRRVSGGRCEDDCVVPVPGTAAARKSIRQGLDGPAVHVDPLKLAFGKKPNGLAIRRPERKRGSIGSCQRT